MFYLGLGRHGSKRPHGGIPATSPQWQLVCMWAWEILISQLDGCGGAAAESGDKAAWPRPGGGASLSPPFLIFSLLFPSPPFPYYLKV